MLHEKKCSSNDACNVHFNSLSSFPAPSQPSLLLPECKPMFASDIAYAGNIEILKSNCFSSSSFFIPPRLATAAATAVAQIFFCFQIFLFSSTVHLTTMAVLLMSIMNSLIIVKLGWRILVIENDKMKCSLIIVWLFLHLTLHETILFLMLKLNFGGHYSLNQQLLDHNFVIDFSTFETKFKYSPLSIWYWFQNIYLQIFCNTFSV